MIHYNNKVNCFLSKNCRMARKFFLNNVHDDIIDSIDNMFVFCQENDKETYYKLTNNVFTYLSSKLERLNENCFIQKKNINMNKLIIFDNPDFINYDMTHIIS